MKRTKTWIVALGLSLAAAFLLAGCENGSMSIGFGYSGHSNGVGYSYGISSGPGGPRSSFGISMYGHP